MSTDRSRRSSPKRRSVRAVADGAGAAAERVRPRSGADYPQLLHAFLVRHDAHMLKLAA